MGKLFGQHNKGIAQVAGLITLTVTLLGCGGITGETVPLSTVAQLEATVLTETPEASPNLENMPNMVAIAGEVVATAPLVNAGLYRINDGTGTLWIRTENLPLPTVGESLRVELTAEYRPIEIEAQNFDQAFGVEQRRSPLEQ